MEAKEGRSEIWGPNYTKNNGHVIFWIKIYLEQTQITCLAKSKDIKYVLFFYSFHLFWTLQVSGISNAKQVILSVRMYSHRPTFLIHAMQALFSIIHEGREFGLNKDLMCRVSQQSLKYFIRELLMSYLENIQHDMNILQTVFLWQPGSRSKKQKI